MKIILSLLFLAVCLGCVPYNANEFPLKLGYYLDRNNEQFFSFTMREGWILYSQFSLDDSKVEEGANLQDQRLSEWSQFQALDLNVSEITLEGRPYTLFYVDTHIPSLLQYKNNPQDRRGSNAGDISHEIMQILRLPQQPQNPTKRWEIQPDSPLTGKDILSIFGNYKILSLKYHEGYVDWKTGLGRYNLKFSDGERHSDGKFRVPRVVTINSRNLRIVLLEPRQDYLKPVEFRPKKLSMTSGLIWDSLRWAVAERSENMSFRNLNWSS